jgi:polyisoprenoid-binding protein YceI
MALEKYSVNSERSKAKFTIGYFYVSSVSGEFSGIDGIIALDKDEVKAGSVDITVETARIDTHNKKRDDHLRSAAFFNVEQYPVMNFKSWQIEKVNNNLVRVAGLFNFHGVAKEISVDIDKIVETKDDDGVNKINFTTKFSIKRSDYGMTYLLPVIGDKVEIELIIEAVAEKTA